MLNQLNQTPDEYQNSINELRHTNEVKSIIIVASAIVIIALSICYRLALHDIDRYKAAYEMQRDARTELIESVTNPQYK